MFEDFRLRVFVTVEELGGFTSAARELGVSQPAISQNIAELEKVVGGKLFERSRSGIALTRRGSLFLAQAQKILSDYKDTEKAFIVPKVVLIQNLFLDGRQTNVLIEDGLFKDLDAPADCRADRTVDATGLTMLPSFFDACVSSSLGILRGCVDDSPFHEPVGDIVRSLADCLSHDDLRRGGEMAVAEMAASGTTFFADEGLDLENTVREVSDRGLRAAIALSPAAAGLLPKVDDLGLFVGLKPEEAGRKEAEAISKALDGQVADFVKNWTDPTDGHIQLMVKVGSLRTMSADGLKKSAAFARRKSLRISISLAQSLEEVEFCVRRYGSTPVRFLDSIGFLGPDVIASHCIKVDAHEWAILAERGVTAVHCPSSDLKLGNGRFPYELALDSGCRIALGTDSPVASGSFDMRAEMRLAALLAKEGGDSALLPATEVLKWATRNGAEAFGIDAGEIAVGKLADFVLVDFAGQGLPARGSVASAWVYSSDISSIQSVFCSGRQLEVDAE